MDDNVVLYNLIPGAAVVAGAVSAEAGGGASAPAGYQMGLASGGL